MRHLLLAVLLLTTTGLLAQSGASRAALRIKTADSLRFVVKMVTMGDPSSMLQFLGFESKNP